ncbi:MAG: M48 family metalloprotease [Rickettsiales bacterium]|nr:M48 family metalloprotease [Rickettsiales bacterium]
MFSKPFNLVLVYIVTVFNIVVLVSPFMMAIIPLLNFGKHPLIVNHNILEKIKLAWFFLFFLVSFLMLFYLFLDSLFGFSVRSSLKNCKRFEKIKDYDFLSDIFEQVKGKFNERNVHLYIKNSDEINAYAVSSFNKRAIVLTHGLIKHYLVECSDPKKFLNAIRSIMGHEMSHLINKDFLPAFLIITNQKVTNLVSVILKNIFRIIARIMVAIPGFRNYGFWMNDIYTFCHFILNCFNRFIVYNIYEFLRRFVSRAVEFRCDRQSAYAFGGNNMAMALSMLGKSGYFTLFSTHPGTEKRIKKLQNIKATEATISPRFVDSIANYFSIMFLMIVCLYFTKQAGVDLMVRAYIQDHQIIYRKLSILWNLLKKIL